MLEGWIIMKVRTSFVSNSSSSSFAVSCFEGQQDLMITITANLEKYGKKIKTKSELYDNMIINELVDDGEYTWEELENLLNEGQIIIVGFFSDEEDPKEYILCHKGLDATNFKGRILRNSPSY
jgi:hypothetical protein